MRVIKKSFGIILTISVISLILLIVGVVLFTKDNNKTFTASGYIITHKSGNTEVYNFDEGEVYKHNVEGNLVFNDKKDKKVVATLDSFIHYDNGNIAFLQNGVILNLEDINSELMQYYNISTKSLLEFNNDRFTIENVNGNLNISRFIGRISDNKYIVSSPNIVAKLAGSADMMSSLGKGNFFEFTYAENGVVIISDGTNTRTMTADKSYIYIGEDIVINLGDKQVYYKDSPKLLLSQMTINGDENIDIVPPEEYKEEEENKDKDKDNNNDDKQNNQAPIIDNNTTNNNSGNNDDNNNDNNNDDKTEDNDKDDEVNDKDDDNEPEVTVTKNPIFKVVSAEISANKLDLDIEVIDEYEVIKGSLNAVVIDMKTSQTVYRTTIDDIKNVVKISTPSGTLNPDTNYIVSITGNYTSGDISYNKQYFQRVFLTEGLSIELTKSFVTNDLVVVNADVGNTLAVKSYDISIFDSDNNEIEKKNILVSDGNDEITFENLNSNSDYKVVLNNISYNNVVYSDVDDIVNYREDGDYTVSVDVKTLKKAPSVLDIKATVNSEMTKVNFNVGNIIDEDNAITGYKYYIYRYNSVTGVGGKDPVMEPISKKDSTAFDVDIDGTKLMTGQSYRYMVVVEYNDNEKLVEYRSGFSNSFVAGAVPSVSYEIDSDKTTFNTLSGNIRISDENCTVPLSGRNCYDTHNDIYVRYYESGTTTLEYASVKADFDPVNLTYKFNATGLKQNTNYIIEVFGSVDFKDGDGIHTCSALEYEDGNCVQIGQSMNASTKNVVPLTVDWGNEKISNENHVFSLGGNQLKSTNNSNNEQKSLTTLTINLYSSDTPDIEDATKLEKRVQTLELESNYFTNKFTINSIDTFGLDIEALKKKTDGLLSRYYIFEITDAYDSAGVNNIPIENNTYSFEINKDLRADDILGDPWMDLEVKQVNNIANRVIVTANYDAINLAKLYPDAKYKITLGACNIATKDCHDLGSEELVDLTGSYTKTFNFRDGTDYYTNDSIKDGSNISLYRGDKYKFRFYITVYEDNDNEVDYYYPGRIEKKYVESDPVIGDKKAENFFIYPVNSTKNSITYSYMMIDSDVSLYKEENSDNYKLYYMVDEEEHSVDIEFNKNKEFTISNLSNNSVYSLYYKTAAIKTGKEEDDVTISYEKKYLFDGFYNLDDYNIKYILEDNSTSNKITIKILDSPNAREILDRISTYELEVKSNKTIIRKRFYSELNDCEAGSGCLKYIDYHYSDVEDFASRQLAVNLYGYYDTGLLSNNSDYGYLVQQNNTDTSKGKYLLLNKGSNVVESDKPYDLYYYEQSGSTFNLYNLIYNNNLLQYENSRIKKLNMALTKTNEGYKYGNYTINYKTVDKKNISIDDGYSNSFIFYSITPDITTSYNPIINGADISINTSSITESVLNKNFIKEDDKFYFYVELYDEDNKIDTKKIEIVPNGNTLVTFDNLDDDKKYGYKVFAKLNKNGESYIQLNDTLECETNECRPKDYEFNTLKGTDLFGDLAVNHSAKSEEDIYSKRNLSLDLTLNSEIVNVTKNYDLIVNLIENDIVVDTVTINNEDIASTQRIDFDITNYDTIFGSDYYKVELIAKTRSNDSDNNVTIYNEFINLKELVKPTISVTKKAITEDGVVSLEYKIAISDNDKVIPNGTYSVRLLDRDDIEVAKIEDINVEDLREIVFANSVEEVDKYHVVLDLLQNKEYTLEISIDSYMNNNSLREEAILNGADINTYINKTSIYNYTIFTAGVSGVSLGELLTSATENSVNFKFFNSANLEKITKMDYTIVENNTNNLVVSNVYTIGEGMDKQFMAIEGSNDDKYYSLLLDDSSTVLKKGVTYKITFQFYVTVDGMYQAISTSNNSTYITL